MKYKIIGVILALIFGLVAGKLINNIRLVIGICFLIASWNLWGDILD